MVVDGCKLVRDRAKPKASTGRQVPIVDPAWDAVAPLLEGLGRKDYVSRTPCGATVNTANYARREFRAAAAAIGKPGMGPRTSCVTRP